MKRARRILTTVLGLALIALGALLLFGHARRHPEDMPWTALDLGQPVGLFTGRKLAALSDDAPRCRALLGRAGVRFTALPARSEGPQCGYDGAVRFNAGGAREIAFRPANLGMNCSV